MFYVSRNSEDANLHVAGEVAGAVLFHIRVAFPSVLLLCTRSSVRWESVSFETNLLETWRRREAADGGGRLTQVGWSSADLFRWKKPGRCCSGSQTFLVPDKLLLLKENIHRCLVLSPIIKSSPGKIPHQSRFLHMWRTRFTGFYQNSETQLFICPGISVWSGMMWCYKPASFIKRKIAKYLFCGFTIY